MRIFFKHFFWVFGICFLLSCTNKNIDGKNFVDNEKSIEEFYREAVKTLASDEFMGRMPFTKGEDITLNYLENKFKDIGLKPGNQNSYFQKVPMVEIASTLKDDKAIFSNGSKEIELTALEGIVGGTKRVVEEQAIEDAELVFAGFGVYAPEYEWNDFEDLDTKGKVLVVLVNDPGFYDDKLFNGKNMTYYGRWTYKYEEAARQGALGVLIVHDTKPASYGWGVVRNGWSGPQLHLQSPNDNLNACAFEGWISGEAATTLFDMADLDLTELKEKALQSDFKPVPMGISMKATLQNKLNKKDSNNVIGVIPGTENPDEYILYTAHWDHFGISEEIGGDSIYNGAADNASGTAGLMTLAKMFAENKPERTQIFLAVTAEEQGLLGSQFYAEHPIYPIKKTLANINMDVLQPFGKMKDIYLVGKGLSNLDDYLIEAAKTQNRTVKAPEDQTDGWFYRSDHFNFAKVGIPTLYIANGIESVEHGTNWGRKQAEDYNANRYHKPQDEYNENWDVSGSVQDLQLLYQVGQKLSKAETYPTWNDGVLFKAAR